MKWNNKGEEKGGTGEIVGERLSPDERVVYV